VRTSYRSVLAAARSKDRARKPSETAQDFQTRLAGELPTVSQIALGHLTSCYEAERYGEKVVTPSVERAAAGDAATVKASLEDLESSIPDAPVAG
jgi:hypothetical protein